MRALRLDPVSALLLAVPLTLAPAPISGQAARDSCVLEIMPSAVDAGPVAVQVTVRFSRDIGAVSGLEASRGSGIAMTSHQTLERIGMAPEEDTGQVGTIDSSRDSSRDTIWLDLVRARPGTHQVIVNGEAGTCTGTLTVSGDA